MSRDKRRLNTPVVLDLDHVSIALSDEQAAEVTAQVAAVLADSAASDPDVAPDADVKSDADVASTDAPPSDGAEVKESIAAAAPDQQTGRADVRRSGRAAASRKDQAAVETGGQSGDTAAVTAPGRGPADPDGPAPEQPRRRGRASRGRQA